MAAIVHGALKVAQLTPREQRYTLPRRPQYLFRSVDSARAEIHPSSESGSLRPGRSLRARRDTPTSAGLA